MDVLATAEDTRPTRWCFRCREHLPHRWELLGDREPSYYDPLPTVRCSRCGGEHVRFPGFVDGPVYPDPGTEWEWVA